MKKEHAAKMMLRISRGSIYDWCLHNGSYDLIEAVHEEISIVYYLSFLKVFDKDIFHHYEDMYFQHLFDF